MHAFLIIPLETPVLCNLFPTVDCGIIHVHVFLSSTDRVSHDLRKSALSLWMQTCHHRCAHTHQSCLNPV